MVIIMLKFIARYIIGNNIHWTCIVSGTMSKKCRYTLNYMKGQVCEKNKNQTNTEKTIIGSISCRHDARLQCRWPHLPQRKRIGFQPSATHEKANTLCSAKTLHSLTQQEQHLTEIFIPEEILKPTAMR